MNLLMLRLSIFITRQCQILLRKVTNFFAFKGLNKKKIIWEKELKYFSDSFKNSSCLGKMYLLPKIHKELLRSCSAPTEKVSEFLDDHLQPVMKSGKSYVKDTGDFL